MSRPQEIIDMVIDYVNLDSDPENRLVALGSCALVGRRFSRRSQMHLFSVVHLLEHIWGSNPSRLVEGFSSLLQTTTHIASFVKELRLQPGEDSLEAACHILRSLPKLEVLDSRPALSKTKGRRRPLKLFEALATTVTLPTLRCLELKYMTFPHYNDFDSFLAQSVGLLHLKLDHVGFASHRHQKRNYTATPNLHCVVLESLTLRDMWDLDIQEVLWDLYAVDVGHLKRLSLHVSLTRAQGLLTTNAHTIQEVHVRTSFPCVFESDILARGSTLHSIYIYATSNNLDAVAPTLRFFGSLRNLNALKNITLNFFIDTSFDLRELIQSDFKTERQWHAIDALLAEAGDEILARLTVYIEIPRRAAGSVGPDLEDILRSKLLSVGGKVVVRVTDTFPSV
ncbi:hypothetical protein B0H11DRAFT_2202211 [Mycena galericulata]|nr:hypothetical protein B0H11DRAFT_2202211 [Mycena galericulata]